jgi:prepilin-type N-terminal cleavage/methylation domain-containing protein
MSNNTRRLETGFTLLELIVVIALLGLVSSLATDFMVSETNQQRYETTQQRMEKIRYAIIGDISRTLNGQPVFSGFIADEGEVPSNLTQLTLSGHCVSGTGSNESDCATDGGTWKSRNGPYLSVTDLKDGWGNNFTYTVPSGVLITSLGLDKTIGTTSTNPADNVYETDQSLTIPANHYAGGSHNIDIYIENNTGEPDDIFCLFNESATAPSTTDLQFLPLDRTINSLLVEPLVFGRVRTIAVYKKATGVGTDSCSTATETAGFKVTENPVYVHNLFGTTNQKMRITLSPDS